MSENDQAKKKNLAVTHAGRCQNRCYCRRAEVHKTTPKCDVISPRYLGTQGGGQLSRDANLFLQIIVTKHKRLEYKVYAI